MQTFQAVADTALHQCFSPMFFTDVFISPMLAENYKKTEPHVKAKPF